VITIRNHPRNTVRSAVLAALALPAAGVALGADASSNGDDVLQEITVTATRREESLSKVPISIAAIGQKDMDSRGVKEIDGLARYTPGLVLGRQLNGGNNISIRGISSGAGAGTTGVYIDDTPIQVRNLAYSSGNAFPALFDLERVEVLRGPQGTLYGRNATGGAINFITAKPEKEFGAKTDGLQVLPGHYRGRAFDIEPDASAASYFFHSASPQGVNGSTAKPF